MKTQQTSIRLSITVSQWLSLVARRAILGLAVLALVVGLSLLSISALQLPGLSALHTLGQFALHQLNQVPFGAPWP